MANAPKPAKRRGFISLQPTSGRKPLSREEFIYWATFFPKVLKVSTEFEYNLPSAKAALNYSPTKSECVNISKGCSATGCTHLEECMVNPHPVLCLTRNTGKYLGKEFQCPAKDSGDVDACKTCPAWTLDCRKAGCAMFSPYCAVCPSFARQGDQNPENADIRKDAATVRREMHDKLCPTGFVGEVGQHGILEVKEDNSLKYDGGIEIPTVGRRFHWSSFYKMCKEVVAPLIERGAYVDERCGQHFHVLAGYFPQGGLRAKAVSELEMPVPEIILANLHQLHRRYELAMFWIMSCGTEMEALTRWARFRQTIFPYSALRFRMQKVVQDLTRNIICMNNSPKDGKYASIAYYMSKFNDEGNVETFHFENRIADGAQSPAVITAWAALCYALVLKAVRCSQYGTVEVGNREFVERVKDIQYKLIDGGNREWGGSRKADTSELTNQDIDFLVGTSKELVLFLKPELDGMGPAYSILNSLAERPCSLRLVDGHTWQRIEEDLMGTVPGYPATDIGNQIQEIVDLSGITDCQSIEEWVDEVAAFLGTEAQDVAGVVFEMINRGLCRWSNPVGSVIAS